ncbi:MAG: hypothetical protein OEL54_05375, partial [Flavobacteriaceae bacterium]|nr:hypothetical protein [Flavobacteriaceae bacterium]
MFKGLSLDQAPPEDIPNRFFLSAPFFGILAGALIIFEGHSVFLSNWSFETIALTHLITLGWVAMIMFGAFYQMIPVLVGGFVPFIKLSRYIHAIFVLGIISLSLGLYIFNEILLTIAVVLLLISIFTFTLQVLIAIFKVKANSRPTVSAMRISVICLVMTLIFGILLISNLLGWVPYFLPRGSMISIHLIFGLFGWILTLVMGVGFYIIPMFYITDPFPIKRAYLILILQVISLILLPVGLIFDLDIRLISLLAIPGFVAVCLFTYNSFLLIQKRKRKIVDSTIRFWRSGLIFLLISVTIFFINLWYFETTFLINFGFIYLMGFALSLTTGMLYKIMPFLIWFHRCSNLIGVPKVPLMKDILSDKHAKIQWIVYSISVFIIWTG